MRLLDSTIYNQNSRGSNFRTHKKCHVLCSAESKFRQFRLFNGGRNLIFSFIRALSGGWDHLRLYRSSMRMTEITRFSSLKELSHDLSLRIGSFHQSTHSFFICVPKNLAFAYFTVIWASFWLVLDNYPLFMLTNVVFYQLSLSGNLTAVKRFENCCQNFIFRKGCCPNCSRFVPRSLNRATLKSRLFYCYCRARNPLPHPQGVLPPPPPKKEFADRC